MLPERTQQTESINHNSGLSITADRKTILIVDDDAVNRMILEGMLQQSGFAVITADNGLQAIDLFVKQQPVMVLMDVMMPVMDGYEAARRIKQHAAAHFVPIIFLTAVTEDAELARCVSSGGDDFLTKPYSKVILLAKIEAFSRMAGLYQTITEQRDEIDSHNTQLLLEQKVAKKIYSRLVGDSCLNLPNLRYILSPMSIFNGDLLLAARTPSGGFNILLGDATGHGLPAAIGTVPVSDIFYALSETGASLEEIVLTLNQKLKHIFPPNFFLCASVINISPDCNLMTVFHGGLPEIIVYSEANREITTTIASKNFPLGIVKNSDLEMQIEILELQPGDRILLYSDGVLEARNPNGDEFGAHRLHSILSQNLPAEVILDYINREVTRFRGTRGQSDDVTMLEINANAALLEDVPVDRHNLESVISNPANWEIRFHLTPNDLRTVNPIAVLIRHISSIQGLSQHREKIYVILSELFNNACDHGVLKLSSGLKSQPDGFTAYLQERQKRLDELTTGCIDISLQHVAAPDRVGGNLLIRVTDSGDGFDYQSQPSQSSAQPQRGGRGVMLAKGLCQEFNYEGKGNVVTASYAW